jgi:predicted HicB family RNase H-like nuclease
MVLKRKLEKISENIEEVILRGGSSPKSVNENESEELRLHLRIPKEIVEKIDIERKSQGGFTSRNTWIIQAIMEKFNEWSCQKCKNELVACVCMEVDDEQ